MAQDMTKIIAEIKSSYDKTNLQDIDLENVLNAQPEVKIGYFLQHMPPESKKDYAINFDPVETLFLEKLVTQEVLDKRIIMKAEDFFRGIVFIDYFANIICGDYGVLDDLYKLAIDLEKRNKTLDPDISLFVRYTGMYYLCHVGKNLVREGADKVSLQRFTKRNKEYGPQYACLRKISPLYEALGKKVHDLAKDDAIKQQLPNIYSLYDLKAALFIDAILEHLQDDKLKGKIMDKIRAEDYYKASVIAITSMSKEVSNSTIDECINSMIARNGAR